MRRDPVPCRDQTCGEIGPGEWAEIPLRDGVAGATNWDVEVVNPDILAPVP
jgi:hypothetical protein